MNYLLQGYKLHEYEKHDKNEHAWRSGLARCSSRNFRRMVGHTSSYTELSGTLFQKIKARLTSKIGLGDDFVLRFVLIVPFLCT